MDPFDRHLDEYDPSMPEPDELPCIGCDDNAEHGSNTEEEILDGTVDE